MAGITGTDRNGNPVEFVNGSWRPIISRTATAARNFGSKTLQNLANLPLSYLSSFTEAGLGIGDMMGREGPNAGMMGDTVASMGPTQNQILAGTQMLGEKAAQVATGSDMPISTFQQAQQNQQQTSDIAAEQNPFTDAASNIGADVAGLLAVRQPGSRSRAIWDMNQAHATRLLEAARTAPQTQLLPAAKNFKQFFGSSLSSSPLFSSLTRGATKAGEAGIDAMILAAMNSQDPTETAAIGAGAQAGSSLLASMLTGFSGTGSWGTRLALEAASVMAILQVGRSLTLGEDGSPIEDFGAAFDKIVAGAALGIFGSLAGGGRLTGTRAFQGVRDLAPEMIEMAQSGMRGISLDLINGMFADPRSQLVMERLAKDPNAFGPTVGRRIERAIRTGNSDLSGVLDSLENSSAQFRNQLNELMGEVPR